MSKNDTFAASVEITVRGHLPGADEYLRKRIEDALTHAPRQVLSVHAALTRHPDPAATDPVVATATVGLSGRVVHARGRGDTVTVAVDRLHDSLERGVAKLVRHRHVARVEHHEEPPAELVRHHTFSVGRLPITEAADELEALGYEFHLFTDLDSGQDCVLYRVAGGYRLARTTPGPVSADGLRLTVSARPAPKLSLAEARERFALDGRLFLFFVDTDEHGGAVLYRRADGALGLVSAA